MFDQSFVNKMTASRTLHGCVDWNSFKAKFLASSSSRTLHGCVDWNKATQWNVYWKSCRTLHGCVDWNFSFKNDECDVLVAPYTGAWIEMSIWETSSIVRLRRTLHGCVDWNNYYLGTLFSDEGRTLHGCVDWNRNHIKYMTRLKVAPYTNAWIEIRSPKFRRNQY